MTTEAAEGTNLSVLEIARELAAAITFIDRKIGDPVNPRHAAQTYIDLASVIIPIVDNERMNSLLESLERFDDD